MSVLNRAQFLLMLKFVYFGFGTKFKPKPRRLVVLGGGGLIVHKLCTAELVHRMKKWDFGRLAMIVDAL
jgi:hypothetical protein